MTDFGCQNPSFTRHGYGVPVFLIQGCRFRANHRKTRRANMQTASHPRQQGVFVGFSDAKAVVHIICIAVYVRMDKTFQHFDLG